MMNSCTKKLLVIAIAGLLLFAFSGPLFARAVWMKGTVTKTPWVDTATRIEIDKNIYTLMLKDDKYERHYLDQSQTWHMEKWPITSLRVGQEVLIKADGRKIYELYVEE